MPLTDEINQAAVDLGLALNASPEMQELFELGAEPGQNALYERQIEMVKALFTRICPAAEYQPWASNTLILPANELNEYFGGG